MIETVPVGLTARESDPSGPRVAIHRGGPRRILQRGGGGRCSYSHRQILANAAIAVGARAGRADASVLCQVPARRMTRAGGSGRLDPFQFPIIRA